MATKPTRKPRRKKAEPSSRGLGARELEAGAGGEDVKALRARVEEGGGVVIGTFRDPLGGAWLALAALPIACVAPTP